MPFSAPLLLAYRRSRIPELQCRINANLSRIFKDVCGDRLSIDSVLGDTILVHTHGSQRRQSTSVDPDVRKVYERLTLFVRLPPRIRQPSANPHYPIFWIVGASTNARYFS
jgi:hypothetical protein